MPQIIPQLKPALHAKPKLLYYLQQARKLCLHRATQRVLHWLLNVGDIEEKRAMAFCTRCGAQLQSGASFCSSCGEKVTASPQTAEVKGKRYLGDNVGMRLLLPVGCSGWAIAAGYCGLFSPLPFVGILLALLSVIFGIIAICVITRNPHKHGVARIVIGWIFVALSVFLHCFLFTEISGRGVPHAAKPHAPLTGQRNV